MVSELVVGELAFTVAETLMSMRRVVTISAMRPGTTAGGMKKLIQAAATRIPLGRYTLKTNGCRMRSRLIEKPAVE